MKHVIVGTAGHIDHGKSALVQALTGTDPDRLKEEKERGITIDLGFAFLRDADRLSLGFVDVPGHERFIKNMLAGVGGIDIVMLVVAADESVMPQTREHFEICRLLHVPRGLVVMTKVDLVEPEVREVAAIEVRELIRGSSLEDAPVVFVSSKTGEGVEQVKRALLAVAAGVEGRHTSGLFRLPVDRVFSMKGFGVVATGTLVSGSIDVDEEIEIVPRGLSARVRGLQVHGAPVDRALAGQRTAVNLQGIEVGQVLRGDSLIRPQTLRSSLMLDADLEVLASAPAPIKDLSRVHLHLGTAASVARVRVLGDQEAIPPGGRGLVQFRLETPMVASPGDRFIVRRYSPLETIGGGEILDAVPPKHSVNSGDVVERLTAMRSGDAVDAAAIFVAEADIRGISGPELARRLGVDATALPRLVERLIEKERVFSVSQQPLLLVSAECVRDIGVRMETELRAFHAANPLREGMPRGELREKTTGAAPVEVFEWVLARLHQVGKARTSREWVASADHRIELSSEEQETRDFLTETYRRAGFQPASLADVATRHRKDPKLLARIERLLINEGMLIRVAEGMVFHGEVLEELKSAIRREKQKDDLVDVAFFKQLVGVTRKYAIPLLEWLDRERVTRRVGKERVVL
jgi:selenocysteine-specific elongation factor